MIDGKHLDARLYSEELAVQAGEGFTENYDRMTAQGKPRFGAGSWRSTCRPASYTQVLSPTGEPGPLPTPTPTPGPTPPPGAACTFTRADFVGKGKLEVKDTTAAGQPRLNFDSTPKVCDMVRCEAAGFPPGRACCPNFPEGAPGVDPTFAAACDVAMTEPRRWTISGGDFCPAGGTDGLGTNPLRNCANLGASGTISESSGGKCAATTFPCTRPNRLDCAVPCAPTDIRIGDPPGGPPAPAPGPVCDVVPNALSLSIEGGRRSGPKGHGAVRYDLQAVATRESTAGRITEGPIARVKPECLQIAWQAFEGNIIDTGRGSAIYLTKSGRLRFKACAGRDGGPPCTTVNR